MEASERPQLQIDSGVAAAVRALGDRLVIESLTINDERSARVVRQRAESGQEAAETVAKAIEIGARVLDREEVAAEVDYVKREFERLASEHRQMLEAKNAEAAERIEDEIRRAFGSEEVEGALNSALEGHSEELSEQLAALFDEGRDTAVHAKIKRTLEERDQAFLDRLSAEDELNPLRPLLSTVRSWAKERREDQDARDQKLERKLDEMMQEAARLAGIQRGSEGLEAAIEAGTQKGLVFEDAVHEEIDRIAAARGDVSRNDAWQELDAELEGRDADFAVLVVSGESKLPARTQELHEYQGNKMVVVFDKEGLDPLGMNLVYRYACARALMGSEGELEVDASGVSALVERAAAALKRGKGIRDSLTKAEQGIDGAREGFNSIVEDVEECLDGIESLIEVAEEA